MDKAGSFTTPFLGYCVIVLALACFMVLLALLMIVTRAVV